MLIDLTVPFSSLLTIILMAVVSILVIYVFLKTWGKVFPKISRSEHETLNKNRNLSIFLKFLSPVP